MFPLVSAVAVSCDSYHLLTNTCHGYYYFHCYYYFTSCKLQELFRSGSFSKGVFVSFSCRNLSGLKTRSFACAWKPTVWYGCWHIRTCIKFKQILWYSHGSLVPTTSSLVSSSPSSLLLGSNLPKGSQWRSNLLLKDVVLKTSCRWFNVWLCYIPREVHSAKS